MSRKSRDFPDEFERQLDDIQEMSDAEVEALLAGQPPPSSEDSDAAERFEPGQAVSGVVIDRRGGEVLVELDSKTHGVVAEEEFEAGEVPRVGEKLRTRFVRYDSARELAVLGVREARREVYWEELRPGMVIEGRAIEANKGGLVLDVKGIRAFLPISQIELHRVEEADSYLGDTLSCEVTSVDRSSEDVIVSRRNVLEREEERRRESALARLTEGEVLEGTVVKLTDYGAFVDLGGVQGLLHASRIREASGGSNPVKLEPGERIRVVVARVDRDRGRISLDLEHTPRTIRSVEEYETGEVVTGWVVRVDAEGAHVSLEEGIEGLVPRSRLLATRERLVRGSLVRVEITSVDAASRRIELRPAGEGETAS